jgi:uncharacterized repeat protein (TIGR03943 family)
MSWNATIIHYVLRVAILLGTGYYVLYLWKSDQLHYYIAPRMNVLILGAGVAVLVLAVHQFYVLVGRLLRVQTDTHTDMHMHEASHTECGCATCERDFDEQHDHDHDHDHEHVPRRFDWKQVVGYSLLLFPLALALFLPETVLSSEIAAKKGINLSSGAQIEKQRADVLAEIDPLDDEFVNNFENPNNVDLLSKPVNRPKVEGVKRADGTTIYGGKNGVPAFVSTGDYDVDFAIFASLIYPEPVIRVEDERYMEYLTTFDLYLKEFVGKKIEVSGFVFREDEMKPTQFIIGRLALNCCSADATPYGVMAELGDAKKLLDNSWVRVTGTVEVVKYGEVEILQLRVSDAVPIKEPKNQYIYPNYDFLNGFKVNGS